MESEGATGMRREPHVYQCPVDAPVQVLGGKWKLVLLFYLLQAPRRNSELRRLVPTISQKMLTQQLRELEVDGIVSRTIHEQVPPHVTYDVEPVERPAWRCYWPRCATGGCTGATRRARGS